jgi:hypothetical protein
MLQNVLHIVHVASATCRRPKGWLPALCSSRQPQLLLSGIYWLCIDKYDLSPALHRDPEAQQSIPASFEAATCHTSLCANNSRLYLLPLSFWLEDTTCRETKWCTPGLVKKVRVWDRTHSTPDFHSEGCAPQFIGPCAHVPCFSFALSAVCAACCCCRQINGPANAPPYCFARVVNSTKPISMKAWSRGFVRVKRPRKGRSNPDVFCSVRVVASARSHR